mmetsp:Transcript_97681/g.223914  ORF Transcript_97681/g.223914 Transcript_97681/m.223914 type:complete len:213 (-) Transcript_97681:476-1114(-)
MLPLVAVARGRSPSVPDYRPSATSTMPVAGDGTLLHRYCLRRRVIGTVARQCVGMVSGGSDLRSWCRRPALSFRTRKSKPLAPRSAGIARRRRLPTARLPMTALNLLAATDHFNTIAERPADCWQFFFSFSLVRRTLSLSPGSVLILHSILPMLLLRSIERGLKCGITLNNLGHLLETLCCPVHVGAGNQFVGGIVPEGILQRQRLDDASGG